MQKFTFKGIFEDGDADYILR